MRIFYILALVSAIFGVCISAQGDDGVAKRPLDLPSGGRGVDEDEEDEPETITFYGSEFEGDGFFWCLDRSGSMLSPAGGGEASIDVLKRETTESVNQLSRFSEFSLVSFASNVDVWSEEPRKASLSYKASAITWVQAMVAIGSTCLSSAGVRTLEVANRCSKRRVCVLILGDGLPGCLGGDSAAISLANITFANYKRLPIHTFFISSSTGGIAFFQSLAAANGGTFTHVQ